LEKMFDSIERKSIIDGKGGHGGIPQAPILKQRKGPARGGVERFTIGESGRIAGKADAKWSKMGDRAKEGKLKGTVHSRLESGVVVLKVETSTRLSRGKKGWGTFYTSERSVDPELTFKGTRGKRPEVDRHDQRESGTTSRELERGIRLAVLARPWIV